MLAYIVRRLLISIPVVIVASMVLFGFVSSSTDPTARFRLSRDPTLVERERERLGLNDPLVVQYKNWAGDFVKGEWGQSYISRRAVSTEIWRALKNTVQLIVWSVLLCMIVAILVGVYSAVRQYSALDYTFTTMSFVGLSIPTFFFALLAIHFLTTELRTWLGWDDPLFYSVGMHSADDKSVLDFFRHAALPILTLSVQLVAGWSRYQRSAMLDVMGADYIRTARAKGVPRRKVVFKHALRNALIPLTTVMAVDVGALFGGLIVTEYIFAWPGMGRLFVDAIVQGDTAVVLPWMIITATFIIGFNLLADVLYGVLDPRIRH
ncbi:MAG TPA: ABC transporter permease [Acidimicrobiales bacterium]|nr:ABC transporter permease [Acidimicrobiales bacterium]